MAPTNLVVSADLDEPEPKQKVDRSNSSLKEPLHTISPFVLVMAEKRGIDLISASTLLKDCPWLN